ncbi:M10 family metallopeptidase [Tropicimonas isoalkanivorans]|uniref:Serralysin n=1 Tax=Tropicimonas isoalkanivorans TaxID=441112 RepID=A0A1I1KCA2_9RHOB|nr:M10 family metallopeptidase [Tropicimonas isoalkanivorans]SFC55723.1 serralysin [Tropicimonas isoalkanivorans]
MKPYYSDLSQYLVTGFWIDSGSVPHDFGDASSGRRTITYDISDLTSAGQKLAVAALHAWENVADVRFVENRSGTPMILFDDRETGAWTSYRFLISSGSTIGVDINISQQWLRSYGTGYDDYSFQTYIHEIGHALGLGHAGDYNNWATFAKDAIFDCDSVQVSIMSYFEPWQNPNVAAKFETVLTPQLADILAVQSIYGAPSDVRQGDTTYGVGTNLKAGRWQLEKFDATWSLTLVDSGGEDTLDMSMSDARQVIRLGAGSFSSVDGGRNNLAIAPGTEIENARSGGGQDRLVGNGADNTLWGRADDDSLSGRWGKDRLYGNSGDDTLNGGKHADLLRGGKGRDTFVFQSGSGRDRVTDFTDDVDRIELDTALWTRDLGARGVVRAFATVQADGDVVFDFGDDVLVVKDVGDRWLLADDLVLA